MSDKPNAMHTVGLELTPFTLKGVELGFLKGKACLVKIFELQLESPSQMPLEVKLVEPNALQQNIKKNLVVTCLNGEEVLIRPLEIKLKKEADIDAVLAFQAEPLLPYPIENAVVDKIKLSEVADGSQLTVVAARKDHFQHHLDTWHKLEVEPESVSCVPVALAAFSECFFPFERPLLVLHIDAQNMPCILTNQGKLQAALTINNGTLNLSQAFERDLQNNALQTEATLRTLNFLEINKETYPLLDAALENLRLEVIRAVYSLSKQTKGEEITTLLLTGEGATFNNLAQALCQTLNKALQTPITHSLFNITSEELQKFAVPIGAALTALPNYKSAINFRQNEFAYPYPWKRYSQAIFIYMGLCMGLAIAFYFLTFGYINYREDQLRQKYSELLQYMHKPYNEFEKEFEAQAGGKKLAENAVVLNIKQLSQSDLIARLQFLDKDLQSSPYYYPLLPNIPTVSDVLAWLSTHPNVVYKDTHTGAVQPLLEIENFNYTLVKKPDQTKKQEKYQAKVEMEFSTPTPKAAREFHDALIAPNAFVDPKGEVKWSTNRGLYRASFFLKDKTLYPPSS